MNTAINNNPDLQNFFGITVERCVKIDDFINTQTNTVKNKLNELLINKPITITATNIQFIADTITFDELKLNTSLSYSCPTQIVTYGSFKMSMNVQTLTIPNVVVPTGQIKMFLSGNIGLAMLPTTNLSVIPDIITVVITNLMFSAELSELANIVQLFNTTYKDAMLVEFTQYMKLNLIKAVPLQQQTTTTITDTITTTTDTSDMSGNMNNMMVPTNNTGMMNMNMIPSNENIPVYYDGAYYYGKRREEALYYREHDKIKHYEYDSDSDSSDWDSDYGYYRSSRYHHHHHNRRKKYYDRQLYRPKHGWGKYK
jgi:hypothetical protein